MSWTEEEKDRLVKAHGRTTYEQLATEMGRSACGVKSKALRMGLCVGRGKGVRKPYKWTPPVCDEMRRLYGTTDKKQLAARLGVSVAALHEQASKMGLARRNQIKKLTAAEEARLVSLNAAGYNDIEIARNFGMHPAALRLKRLAMGLPSNRSHPRQRGLSNEKQSAACAAFAAANGWPDFVRPRGVQILNTLARLGVPVSSKELAELTGIRLAKLYRQLRRLILQDMVLVLRGNLRRLEAINGQVAPTYTLSVSALSHLERKSRGQEKCRSQSPDERDREGGASGRPD